MSNDVAIVIIVEGGVVQGVMVANDQLNVSVYLLDYDNLKAGQKEPVIEQLVEVNPPAVESVISGEHPDVKKYVEQNRELPG